MPTLPNTYQRVEYIQSTGTQYIDTGFIPSNNTKIVLSMGGFTNGGSNRVLFGARAAWNEDPSIGRGIQFSVNTTPSPYDYGAMWGKKYSLTGGPFSWANGGDYILEVSQSGFYENGVNKLTPTTATFTSPVNLHIFNLNSNGTTEGNSSYKLYYLKIYESGTLVREFVPCYRISDDVIGLYDLVNDVFYTNAGTGTFNKGPNSPTQGKIKRIYVGENLVRPVTKITEAGIYWDSNSGLISFQTSNGVGITIADKNLGATEVNGQGNAYQWGNNYGWAYNVNPTSYTSTKVNASTYGPGNYYSSSTFIYTTGSDNASYYWDSSNSANLWGGTTGTYAAMQGPCPTGFHVPSRADFTTLVNAISGITGSVTGPKITEYCKLPSGAAIPRGTHVWATRSYTGFVGSQNSASYNYRASFLYVTSSTYNVNEYVAKADGVQVRPFKNEFVQPDVRWTKLN